MKSKIRPFILILLFSILLSSYASNLRGIQYSFHTAKDVHQTVAEHEKVLFTTDNSLDLGFYEGEIWIKLDITNSDAPASYMVMCNDLINHNYRFYKLDTASKTYIPQVVVDTSLYDHRTFRCAKPNFQIDLKGREHATFLITTSSDGRILQATPSLLSMGEFQSIKQKMWLFDVLFYSIILLLLIFNLFYFSLIRTEIYYYYGAYILSSCLMYLFVEGRLYGLGLSNLVIDHLMFISLRLWALFSILFALNFLEIKSTNPKYYRFIIILLFTTIGLTTLYQLVFIRSSISLLHQMENMIGFVWIIFSLVTVVIAFKKRKIQSIYYIISFSLLLLFVTLGLLDSHYTILPGDPFSWFKIGTILEFIGFTYFITLIVRQKLRKNDEMAAELFENKTELEKKDLLLAFKKSEIVSVFKLVENSLHNEEDWIEFKERFKDQNPNFLTKLLAEHQDLSKSEIRLLTLIKIGYTQKEIASILNIAPDSVKKARSRVRKKLSLSDDTKLSDYLSQF